MTRKRPVGSAESAVLLRLANLGGRWTEKDKPLWESMHWTRVLLGALAGKGLVDELVPGVSYALSQEGVDLVHEYGPYVSPRSVQGNGVVHSLLVPSRQLDTLASSLRHP